MQSLDVEQFDREDFLEAPALFRYGPWAVCLASLLIVIAGFVAAFWRIDDGRINEYVRALGAAQATAIAAREDIGQNLDRVAQATRYLESVQRRLPDEDASALFDELSVGEPLLLGAYAFDAQGELLHARRSAAFDRLDLTELLSLDGVAIGSDRFLPVIQRPGAPAVLPVVHTMHSTGRITQVVYLIAVQAMTSSLSTTFSTYGGWLRVSDRHGRVLLQFYRQDGVDHFSAPTHRIRWSADQAMDQPLDYESANLLAARAPADRRDFDTDVGLTERYALMGYERRVISTWLIVWTFTGSVLCMALLTAAAIRKFARKEAYLRRLATVDALTGLPNRRSFHALLDRSVRTATASGRSLGLLFLDLDNFKSVNDSIGHTAGDALLKHVAATLPAVVPRGSHVCRLGGDEFTVLLPNSTAYEAQATGEQMLEQLKKSRLVDGMLIRARASIGIAAFPEHAADGLTLMQVADTAMYRAKAEGRSRCMVFHPSMSAIDAAQAKLMLDLEQAISNDGLTLVYQPKYSLLDGSISGWEALLRWTHPTLGPVAPASFIAQAENSGIIIELGAWVISSALTQMRRWYEKTGRWFAVAVNVSANQLRDEAFVLLVADTLQACGVPGNCLQLELTETTLARDVKQARHVIRQLRELGVSIAIDDFGTGFSSMASLQQFEVDCLKLDRSFVNRVETKEGLEVCKAVIALGQALSLRVVAEGVETVAQCRALAALHCDDVQGFLFSKPVHAAQVPGLAPANLSRERYPPPLAPG